MELADQDVVSILAARSGAEWPSIARARTRAAEIRERLAVSISDHTSEDTSLVVFGSLARKECTSGSDLDWVLLVDGAANAEHLEAALAIESHIQTVAPKGPGPEKTFGGLVFSHDLMHYIGGGDDTNQNMTQRMLLLLESTPVGRTEAYSRVMNNVLKRYVVEDFGWMHSRNPSNVPRFLHNDVVRYWRTIAVDFAYKLRTRAGQGWALRTAKLRMSRKLTYAAGLLRCYNCALEPSLQGLDRGNQSSAALPLVDFLASQIPITPLDLFARTFLTSDRLTQTAEPFFGAYDEFLGILDDEEKRSRLDSLQYDEIAVDPTYQRVRELGHSFQESLNAVFFSEQNHAEFFRLTKTYGVF
jgi:predicted nucleotidyltransferase